MKFLNIFLKLRRVDCPDGTSKYIHKDVNNAIPIYVREYDATLFGRIESELKGDAVIGGEFKNKIHDLLTTKDENYASLIHEFRVLYGTFSTDPCSYSDFFLDGVKQILNVHQALKLQSSLIRDCIEYARMHPGDPALLETTLEVLKRKLLYEEEQEVTEAFKVSRMAAREFRRQNDGL